MKFSLLYAVVLFALIFACARKKIPENALIQVGDKYLTTKEFLYRGELTTYPNFPRHNRNLEKILLNNLIMEKLFILEHGAGSDLARNENFQGYIRGIQEQKMRERLFYEQAYNTVQLDSNEINKRYILSQREYDLEFYSIYNDSIARAFRDKVRANPDSALQLFNNAWDTDQRPTWSVKWKDPDHVNIHEALYSGAVAVDSVIGPMPLDHGQWIWMKVVNWKDVLLMGGLDAELRHKEVIEKTTLNKATLAWDAYMRQVMRGKQIDFDVNVFKKIADLIYDMRTANDPEAKNLVMQRFWQVEDSTLTIADLPTEEAVLQQPFFTIDGVTWTVGDFRQAVASHPLVYRKQAGSRGQFYEQFRIAVVDLVRDHYLNKEAYKDGLDKDPEVQRTVEMWHDALLATYERDQALKRMGSALPDTSDPYRQQKLQKAFDDYLQELRTKYHAVIKVNLEEFEKLELSQTQMFVLQNRVPYPVAVPGWPMFGTENTIDYAILNSE